LKAHQPPDIESLTEHYKEYVAKKPVSGATKTQLTKMLESHMYHRNYMLLESTRRIMNKTEILMSAVRTARLLGFYEQFTRVMTGFVATQV